MGKLDNILNNKKSENLDFLSDGLTGNRERLRHTFKFMSTKSKIFIGILILGITFCTYSSIKNTVEIIKNYPLVRKIEISLNVESQKTIDTKRAEEKPAPPNDWVKIPSTSFKSKEEVTILFEQAGLKPLFVPQHIEFEADINKKNLSVGTTISINSQPNAKYFDGDDYGYYAPKGSEIIVGYSPVEYQYQERD